MHVYRAARQVGFTLLELMVVVAILSILAALVIPAYYWMVEHARRAICQTNLGAIFKGMLMYEQDVPEHCQPRWMQHNLCHYGTSHLNFYGLRYDRNYANEYNQPDVGYSGLGKLIGSNDPMATVRHVTDFTTLPNTNNPHYKYIGRDSLQVFFCPSSTDTYMNDSWWQRRWDTFPFGRYYDGRPYAVNQICYSMRPGKKIGYNIPDDYGFNLDTGNHWRIDKQFSIQHLQHANGFKGQAVAADATGSIYFIHDCHKTGVNVIYRNASVSFYEDADGYLGTHNNVSIWSYGRDYALRQVRIWTAFDDRFNP
jgi:prepilin-type N-terminal cleavage/methylation domain-containing protein